VEETATGSEEIGCVAALAETAAKGGAKLGTAKVGGGHGGTDECPPTATSTAEADAAAAAAGRTDGMRVGATIAFLACGAAGACSWAKPQKPRVESDACGAV